MKLTKTDFYAIIATVALIFLLLKLKQGSDDYQTLNEELNDYQVERAKIMLEIEALQLTRDSIYSLYLKSKEQTPDIGQVEDRVEVIREGERTRIVRLSANATVERLRWVWRADTLLRD